jgi:multisubunit Na+/H+ antiporter MnhB subunit
MYLFLTVLKAIIVIVATSLILINIVAYFQKKEKLKLRKVILVFIATFLMLILLSTFEFILIYKQK